MAAGRAAVRVVASRPVVAKVRRVVSKVAREASRAEANRAEAKRVARVIADLF